MLRGTLYIVAVSGHKPLMSIMLTSCVCFPKLEACLIVSGRKELITLVQW